MLLVPSSSTKSIKFIPHPHPLDAPGPVVLARLGALERTDRESSPGYDTLKHGVVGLINFELFLLGATDDAAEKIALESLDGGRTANA